MVSEITNTTRRGLAAATVLLMLGGVWGSAPLRAQSVTLTGGWTLDRRLSQFPQEIGFGTAWPSPERAGAGQEPTEQGGRQDASNEPSPERPRLPESEEEAARVQLLTAEVREPAYHLTIADTGSRVTIADDRGHWRTLRIDAEETLTIGGVPVPSIARRLPDGVEVIYDVDRQRELRYVYSRSQSPSQLIVEVQFLDHGKGDTIKRVYEPSTSLERQPAFGAAAPAPATGAKVSGAPAPPPVNQRPAAALNGLRELSVDVEGIDADATACGLQQDAIKTAISKHFTDAGLKVIDYSKNDTYLNVRFVTEKLSTGLCVSRYDVSLETQTTATLSYEQTPVPVEATLLRQGGLAGSDASTHGAEVLRGVLSYVDQFVTRIHNAGKP